MSTNKICEKYNVVSQDLETLGSNQNYKYYYFLYQLKNQKYLFTDYNKTIIYTNNIFQKHKYSKFIYNKIISKIVKTDLSYPVTSDLFESLHFAISETPLEEWEIPIESDLVKKSNPNYSNKIYSIVIVHESQMSKKENINLETNPFNNNDGYFVDEFLPDYIQNYSFNSRMFAFLSKEQKLTDFVNLMIQNGATYSDNLANQLNSDADSIYLTTGDLK